MAEHATTAQRLESALSLHAAPIAITFTQQAPSGLGTPSAPAPAGCSFWERGTQGTFVTAAADHENCAIGVHTHQLAGASTSVASELGAALEAMTGLDYVRPQEIESLPVMAQSHAHVVYGPLAEVPADATPNVVLVFAQASQSLVVTEAVARVDGAPPFAMGRPACALIPQVSNSGNAAMSLGCCGARAYLGVLSDDVALWGFPGDKVEAYVKEIETLAKANTVLTQFHASRKTAIEAGETPTVGDTLATLG